MKKNASFDMPCLYRKISKNEENWWKMLFFYDFWWFYLINKALDIRNFLKTGKNFNIAHALFI